MMKNAVMLHFKSHSIVLKLETTNIGEKVNDFLGNNSICSIFRLILRCRQLARDRFAKMRADVLVKLELLDQKHGSFSVSFLHSKLVFLLVQDIVFQLHRFITALDKYHKDCNEVMKEADIFPIEVDLSLPTLRAIVNNDDEDDDENEDENDHDLIQDDQQQQQFTSNQRQIVQDADLLNLGH